MSGKPLLRVREAAERLGVCRKTLSKWIARGLLRKIPGSDFITVREVERFLEEPSGPKTPEQRRRGRYKVGGRK
ncbi:MAG: helix-turn-helix domain-containing protein [Spirochaetes bacterium]|nr:helix-turn-helix domain-containing protein [Spirochaetota bacterium]